MQRQDKNSIYQKLAAYEPGITRTPLTLTLSLPAITPKRRNKRERKQKRQKKADGNTKVFPPPPFSRFFLLPASYAAVHVPILPNPFRKNIPRKNTVIENTEIGKDDSKKDKEEKR